MLEQLFGSKTRVQLLTLFIRNPQKQFYIREIVRITGQYINSVRRELSNLELLGILKTKTSYKKKYYYLNSSFVLYEETKNLFQKSKAFLENDLTNALKELGDVKLLIFTGNFVNTGAPTDLLIVGDHISVVKLRKILENFSISVGADLRYTLFDIQEYLYRKSISDKFVEEIVSNKNIVLIDKL